jgi:hypothetical protein
MLRAPAGKIRPSLLGSDDGSDARMDRLPSMTTLGRDERAELFQAVNSGRQVADPRLRPLAVEVASGFLNRSGWRSLREPSVIVLALIGLVLMIWKFAWLGALVYLLILLASGVIAERRRAGRADDWRSAIALNSEDVA